MDKKISKKVSAVVRDYVKVLKKDIPVERVVLYGSHAKGESGNSSDIDVAVISSVFGRNPHEEGKYLFRKLWDVKSANIDPIGYSPKSFLNNNSPLVAEIKKYGVEIDL